jgi:hypothetical protein
LINHFGGEFHATGRFPLEFEGSKLGSHRFTYHAEKAGFMVTGFGGVDEQWSHIARLLSLSPFSALQ